MIVALQGSACARTTSARPVRAACSSSLTSCWSLPPAHAFWKPHALDGPSSWAGSSDVQGDARHATFTVQNCSTQR